MEAQQLQQIHQFKIMALQAAEGNLANAQAIFDWLAQDLMSIIISAAQARIIAQGGAIVQ